MTAQHIEGRDRALVDAETRARVALRVEVDDEHALADRCERGAEIDGGRGLADAALLVGEREHAGALAGAEEAHRGPASPPARGRRIVTPTMCEVAAVKPGTSPPG